MIRTHDVRMAAQFLDAADADAAAAAGAARLSLSGAQGRQQLAALRPSTGWRQSGQTSQNGASTKSRLCISGCGRRSAQRRHQILDRDQVEIDQARPPARGFRLRSRPSRASIRAGRPGSPAAPSRCATRTPLRNSG